MKRKRILMTAGRIVILSFFLLLVILPIYWMFITSLKLPGDISTLDIQYWPKNPTLDNYRAVLGGSGFPVYLANSLTVAVVSALIVLLVAIPGGYGLSLNTLRRLSI